MTSKKFEHIKSLSKKNDFSSYIPPYEIIEKHSDIGELFTKFKREFSPPFILRSALFNEASKGHLRCGESITCSNINSLNEFKEACCAILGQQNLDEVILQVQFLHSTHLTIFLDKDFTYIEYLGSENGVFSESSNFSSGKMPYQSYKKIKTVLNLLSEELQAPLLIEAGINELDIRLYQVVEVDSSIVEHLSSRGSICKMYYDSFFNYSPSLLNLLKVELSAFLFRLKKNIVEENPILMAHKNWFFLLHYFTLYCRIYSLTGSSEDWSNFIQSSYQKPKLWLSKLVSQHVNIANLIRPNEKMNEIPSMIKGNIQCPIFIGKGKYDGDVDQFNFHDDLTVSKILNYNSTYPILSQTNFLLSHPVLLAIENKTPLVLNIPQNQIEAIKNGQKLFIDFNNKQIILE